MIPKTNNKEANRTPTLKQDEAVAEPTLDHLVDSIVRLQNGAQQRPAFTDRPPSLRLRYKLVRQASAARQP